MVTRTAELETPALLLDMTAMEANLARMAGFFQDGPTRLRPHYKNHKCPALAKRQLAAGAIGITCATLREAEALVRHGVKSILIATEIAGPVKIRQFVELSRRADVIVGVDHPDAVAALGEASRSLGVPLSVLVDVDVGLGRCGIRPGEPALALARQVIESGLRFRGLMGYEGRLQFPPGPEKEAAAHAAMERVVSTRRLIEAQGIPVEIVSVSGTGGYALSGRYPGVTELQAGSYVVMDTEYRAVCPDFEPVLTVLARVISATEKERFVLDAGLKAISSEHGVPMLKNMPGAQLRRLGAEHGTVEILDPALRVGIGDLVEIWVHYSDATVNLHDTMYAVRDGRVEDCFRIEG